MDNYGSEIVAAARARIGAPFRHHFKPENICGGGTVTVDACMERGLDSIGYDCSGLVISSLCDILGIRPQQWSRNYRHAKQLEKLAEPKRPTEGDVLLFYPIHADRTRRHIGIFVTEQCTIHASGLLGQVDEARVAGVFRNVKVIPAATLMGLELG